MGPGASWANRPQGGFCVIIVFAALMCFAPYLAVTLLLATPLARSHRSLARSLAGSSEHVCSLDVLCNVMRCAALNMFAALMSCAK